ncbi:OmpH family outer membrane protein [Pelomicrobium methylotrophicum]|uniref:OmpH family outer membrane protein n=2 Tax=Pelomicrobium methylotrophicum TaxID=2602750 RepID=A0A5C7EP70_9PROT|nr:OmpH family outer membrane protein [Pelomicrobium methylotrophicum]
MNASMRITIAALTLALGAGGAWSAELKIGIVHVERIMRESAPAVRAQKKIEREFSARDQEIQKMIKQARDLQSSLEKEGVTMPESERAKKERDLANLNRDLQRAQREFREDLNLRRNEETAQILQKADRVIKQIAEQEKFDLILQQEAVVYRSPRIDITDRVIKALDAEK